LSAALSNIASASSFFSRRFSSSSDFSRRASETSSPPYFAFHLQKVASEIPCRRHTSGLRPRLGLPQNPDYLFLAEPAALHLSVSFQ
jgi:hypothetical protein